MVNSQHIKRELCIIQTPNPHIKQELVQFCALILLIPYPLRYTHSIHKRLEFRIVHMLLSLHAQQDAVRVDDADKHVVFAEFIIESQVVLWRQHDRRSHKRRDKADRQNDRAGFFFQIEPVLRDLLVTPIPFSNQTDFESGIIQSHLHLIECSLCIVDFFVILVHTAVTLLHVTQSSDHDIERLIVLFALL